MDLNIPVTLVVKAPNQRIEDHVIECGLSWTIKKLKECLSKSYPSKPDEDKQKIIYSGKLLSDNLLLKDVLRQYDDQNRHTVHLVCSPQLEECVVRPKSKNTNEGLVDTKTLPKPVLSNSEAISSATPTTQTGNGSTVSTGVSDGVRFRNVNNLADNTSQISSTNPPQHYDPYAYNQFYQQWMYASMMAYSQNSAMSQQQQHPAAFDNQIPAHGLPYSQQMMWMNHLYSQQMNAYMQQNRAMPDYRPTTSEVVTSSIESPEQPTPAAPAAAPAAAVLPEPVQAGAAIPNAAANAERPPVQRMNAGAGGPVMDDEAEGGARDWLDWIYTLSRLLVLFSIVYFYSTMHRFFVVLCLGLIFYIQHMGWLNPNRRNREVNRAEQAREPVNQENAQQNENRENGNGNEREESSTQNGEESNTEQEMTNQQPPSPGMVSVFLSFITSFFTSLVPTQPPEVQAN